MSMNERPVSIDLFSGAGGLSLGFEQAGFEVVAAVEIDPIHAAIHKYNFPGCAVVPKSIERISGEEVREISGVGSREIEVIFGGPPCQGFSLIGQRMLADPRNNLVKEFLRIVTELSPAYFLFENVKGLTVGKQRRFLHELVAAFQESGYRVRLPWMVLNAANFGVPQDRERLFLMGARDGLPIPDYPLPVTDPPAKNGNLSLLPTSPTCREALADLPEAEDYGALNDGDAVACDAWGKPSAYARKLRCVDDGSWYYGYRREWNPRLLTASARTDRTEISRRRFKRTMPGNVEPISRFFKLPPDGVSIARNGMGHGRSAMRCLHRWRAFWRQKSLRPRGSSRSGPKRSSALDRRSCSPWI